MMSTSKQNNKYCTKYDAFLSQMRQQLKNRLNQHLNLRQPMITKAVNKTIAEIIRLGYRTSINIGEYNQSFVNETEINILIDEWQGPIISKQYQHKFDQGQVGEIDFKKFSKDSVNWLDQSSYKVTGPFFFAPHITAVRQYLIRFCENIININDMELKQRINQLDLINYSCLYFAVELLSTKTKFRRSKEQPLIRHKTLVNCNKLHVAFNQLYHRLDLEDLKKIVKRKQKAGFPLGTEEEKAGESEHNTTRERESTKAGKKKKSKTKGKSSRYRVNAASFAENFIVLCKNLLNAEKQRFGIPMDSDEDRMDNNGNINNTQMMPAYFQDIQPPSAPSTPSEPTGMDIDSNSDTTTSLSASSPASISHLPSQSQLQPQPHSNQPPKPPLPAKAVPPPRPPFPISAEAFTFATRFDGVEEQQHGVGYSTGPPSQTKQYQVPWPASSNYLCNDEYNPSAPNLHRYHIPFTLPVPAPIQVGSLPIPRKEENVILVCQQMRVTDNGLQPLSLPWQTGYNPNRGAKHYGSTMSTRHAPYRTVQQPLVPSFTPIQPQFGPNTTRYASEYSFQPEYDHDPPQSPTHSMHSSHSSYLSPVSYLSQSQSTSDTSYNNNQNYELRILRNNPATSNPIATIKNNNNQLHELPNKVKSRSDMNCDESDTDIQKSKSPQHNNIEYKDNVPYAFGEIPIYSKHYLHLVDFPLDINKITDEFGKLCVKWACLSDLGVVKELRNTDRTDWRRDTKKFEFMNGIPDGDKYMQLFCSCFTQDQRRWLDIDLSKYMGTAMKKRRETRAPIIFDYGFGIDSHKVFILYALLRIFNYYMRHGVLQDEKDKHKWLPWKEPDDEDQDDEVAFVSLDNENVMVDIQDLTNVVTNHETGEIWDRAHKKGIGEKVIDSDDLFKQEPKY